MRTEQQLPSYKQIIFILKRVMHHRTYFELKKNEVFQNGILRNINLMIGLICLQQS